MTIHALKRGRVNALFRSRHEEVIEINVDAHAAVNETFRQTRMFTHLSQSPHVSFNRFAEVGKGKIPFVSQTVAPTARFQMSIEGSGENFQQGIAVTHDHQIKIVPEIR